MERTDFLEGCFSGHRRILGICAIGVLILGIRLLFRFEAGAIPVRANPTRTQQPPLVNTQQWTKPGSGWLYVLDYNGLGDTSQILLVNPEQRSVVGVVQAGYAPDMALAPDGKRLYIASGAPGSISVLNTETGNIEAQFPATYRVVQLGMTVLGMTVSADNRWLFVLEYNGGPPQPVYYGVAVFDTLNNGALVSRTPTPGCGVGRLAWISETKMLLHCAELNGINVLTVDGAGQVVMTSALTLPTAPRPGSAPGIKPAIRIGRTVGVSVLPDGKSAVVFTRSGAVAGLDLMVQRLVAKMAEPRTDDRWINFEDWPHSSDGRKIYIGTGPIASRSTGEADEIDVFDTAAWHYTEAIKTSVPFLSLTLSRDDRYLYAISPSKRRMLIFDTTVGTEVGSVELPAADPRLAIVTP